MSPRKLPRTAKIKMSEETVSCFVRLRQSRQICYLGFKKDITRRCFIRLERIKVNQSSVYPVLDMPLLSSNTDTPGNQQIENDESTHAENPVEEPVWLDSLDDLSQLLVCFLLTRQTKEFIRCLLTFEEAFSAQQLHACVEMMLLMPIDYVLSLLNAALQTPKLETLLSSIIINLIIYIVQDDPVSSKISVLLSLVRTKDLNLWNDNIMYLTSEIHPWQVCFIVVHLFTCERDLATAVDIICEEDIILKMLQGGKKWPTEIKMYSAVLVELMHCIYVKKKCELARKLVIFNLSSETLIPKTDVWVALALGTLISKTSSHVKHIAQVVEKVLIKGIKLPDALLRSSLVRLKYSHPDVALKVFETAETYKVLIRTFPSKGPIPKIITLHCSETWAISEFQVAFLWVGNNIKNRNPDAKCGFSIKLLPDNSLPEESIDGKINFSQLWFPLERSTAMSRLEKALKQLDLPVAVSTGMTF